MRVTKKRVIIFSLLMIMGVLSVVRIMYVNAEQQVRQVYTYKAGETFEYNGFQIRMEADIYSADDMKSMYQEIPEEVLADIQSIPIYPADWDGAWRLSRSVCLSVFKSGSKREHCPRKRRNENSDACFPDRKRRIGSGRTDKADPGAISGEI